MNAFCEAMRVHAGFESSWTWILGVNPHRLTESRLPVKWAVPLIQRRPRWIPVGMNRRAQRAFDDGEDVHRDGIRSVDFSRPLARVVDQLVEKGIRRVAAVINAGFAG